MEYNRNGTPSIGFVIGRLTANDHRFIANSGDQKTLEQLASSVQEPIGRLGWVHVGEDGRNLFSFDGGARL